MLKLIWLTLFFYEGKYNSRLITNFTWSCHEKIKELNKMIRKEQKLLNFISQEKLPSLVRSKIIKHVEEVKSDLENKKQEYYHNISKQKRNFEGQKKFLQSLENTSINVKTTPLKQREGEVYQKGVDVLLAIDMINLAHNNAYDLAILLSGDTDLIESVKMIKNLGKNVVIVSYNDSRNHEMSNISDLMKVGKFINLKDLTDEEIEKMSELRR